MLRCVLFFVREYELKFQKMFVFLDDVAMQILTVFSIYSLKHIYWNVFLLIQCRVHCEYSIHCYVYCKCNATVLELFQIYHLSLYYAIFFNGKHMNECEKCRMTDVKNTNLFQNTSMLSKKNKSLFTMIHQ